MEEIAVGDRITFEGVHERPNIILRLLIWLGWKSPPPPQLRQFVIVDQIFSAKAEASPPNVPGYDQEFEDHFMLYGTYPATYKPRQP